jgi:tight adherence protein C
MATLYLIAIIGGVLLSGTLILGVVGFRRLTGDVPSENRSYLDPLPGTLRSLWPLIRFVDYHFCGSLPEGLLRRPERLLQLAGISFLMSSRQFIGLSFCSAVLFIALALLPMSMLDAFNPFFMLAAAGLGAFYPTLWLKGKLKKRRLQVIREMPAYLEFMTMAIEAGLNLVGALQQAVDKGVKGPLRQEFGLVLRDLRSGLTRAEALTRMDERMQLKEISNFVKAVIQADRMGASLGQTFRFQAEQRRMERFQRAEKLAMEAPVKLIFPLVAFIFPETFVVLAFPIAIKAMQSGVFG